MVKQINVFTIMKGLVAKFKDIWTSYGGSDSESRYGADFCVMAA
jgi:hypothetical protein